VEADKVLIPEIYAARDTEADIKGVNCEILAREVNKVSKNAKCIPEFKKITEYLKTQVRPGDVVITVGAGPVYKIGEEFLKND
jgi:UDP-N-acetylmuramate--alanine ligase